MTTWGYARQSHATQNGLIYQRERLNEYGIDDSHIFTDCISGKAESKPGFEKLCSNLEDGDTVVITELSRLARSTKQLLNIVDEWVERNIKLVSMRENLDLSSASGRCMLTVLSAMVMWETEMRAERQRDGIEARKHATGKCGGRPKTDADTMNAAIAMYLDYQPVSKITSLLGVSSPTLYREMKRRGIQREEK